MLLGWRPSRSSLCGSVSLQTGFSTLKRKFWPSLPLDHATSRPAIYVPRANGFPPKDLFLSSLRRLLDSFVGPTALVVCLFSVFAVLFF